MRAQLASLVAGPPFDGQPPRLLIGADLLYRPPSDDDSGHTTQMDCLVQILKALMPPGSECVAFLALTDHVTGLVAQFMQRVSEVLGGCSAEVLPLKINAHPPMTLLRLESA